MAKLSQREQELLDSLSAKAKAPDEPPINKSVSFSIDLNDDKQIARAQKLGLLPSDFTDDEDGDGDDDDDDTDKDAIPRRRSYFKE